VYAERSETWKKRIETLFTNAPYGRNLSLSGFDLYMHFNQSLRRISDNLFETFEMAKLAIDTTDRLWDTYLDEACTFLGLRKIADPFRPSDYCGVYASGSSKTPCQIELIHSMARIRGLFKATKYLLPKSGNTVFVQTWPDELTFATDNAGKVESFRSTGPWNRIGDDVWRRVNID
jgi:hypothetical protein